MARGFLVHALLAAAVAAAAPAGAAASPHDTYDIGPAVGSATPHDLAAKDQEGRERSLRALTRARGLVILFNRSLDW